ncbi:MAG: prepilin peptidase [Lachnospiraceae bacterium]|nr:prepilin peptidase [Lachnospiraceae bacterium]
MKTVIYCAVCENNGLVVVHNGRILMKRRLHIVLRQTIMPGMEARIEIIVLLLLGAAVLSDLKTEKVPNRLILAGYALGALYRIHAPPELAYFVWDIVYPIALLYPLYLARGLGAGDIKLFSVLSVFYPFSILIQIMIFSLYVGAGQAACRLAYARVFHKEYKNYIHYTICILLAYLIYLMQEAYL